MSGVRLYDINGVMENVKQLTVHLLLFNPIPSVQSLAELQRLKQQQPLSPMNVLWEQLAAY